MVSFSDLSHADFFGYPTSNSNSSSFYTAKSYVTSVGTDKFGIAKLCATKVGGRTWYSDAWNNGKVRSIARDGSDPYDSRLMVARDGIKILGNGIATIAPGTTQEGQRVFVDGPWYNTEMTIYVNVKGSCPSFQMYNRSNHNGPKKLPYGYVNVGGSMTSCGFGGYIVKWSQSGDNTISQQVELIHGMYSKRNVSKPSQQPPKNQWTGYKSIVHTYGSEVKVQGYILRDVSNQNWVKETEFKYNATNGNLIVEAEDTNNRIPYCLTRGDKVTSKSLATMLKNCAYLNPTRWSWVRFEGGIKDIDVKFFSVREIAECG